MAGYIGSKASVVSSGVERKKTYSITGSTTSLTGLNYTVGKVHVFQNGVRLLDGTDYTATNGTSITLTVAAQSGDNVVVVSQASFQVSESYTSTESDARYVNASGDTMTGNLNVNGTVTSDGLTLDHNTSLYTADKTFSSFNATNGVYLNGNAGGWVSLSADGSQRSHIRIYGQTSSSGEIMAFNTAAKQRMVIASNGDISFYEDTGVTAKFFWDASAESLEVSSAISGAGGWNEALTLNGTYPLLAFNETGTGKHSRIGNNGDGSFQFFVNGTANAVGTNALVMASSGNVGIGTSSPSAKLEVLSTYASDSTEQVRFRDNTGGSLDFYGYANATKAIQALDSSDNDNPKNLMLNPLGGNVGIGTNSPSKPFHLKTPSGWATVRLEGATDSGGELEFYKGSTKAGAIFFDNSNNLNIRTGNTQRMVIDASGRVTMPSQPIAAYSDTRSINLTNADLDSSNFYNSQFVNRGNHFSTSTGRFTCPVAGVYRIMWRHTESADANIRLRKNGSTISEAYSSTSGTYNSASAFAVVSCSANDYLHIQVADFQAISGTQHKFVSFELIS